MKWYWAVSVLVSILIISLGLQPTPASAEVIDVGWSLALGPQDPITINQGDTVKWTWEDSGGAMGQSGHDVVTIGGAESFVSDLLFGIGQTFSHTFTEVGTTTVVCATHLIMSIDIIVNPAQVPIGGTLIPIDTTALLVAGAQTMTPWLILGVLSAVGIGLTVFTIKRR